MLKKKRVSLVDTSRAKRDVRSETMRKLGVEVDCAADISDARCWWRRISTIRSVYNARTRAICNRPETSRDNETARLSRALNAQAFDFIREELQ